MLEKRYDPQQARTAIDALWEDGGFFHANASSDKIPYCIVMPPPNITGVLHMGHALVSTVQDALIRWKRMEGYEALWVPGIDHAGISTQTVVERHLIATTGKRRKDFSREDFLAEVWKWKGEKEAAIIAQLKAMGCSCDWSRYRFTMDDHSNRAVRTMFKKLYDAGLIYQGDYLVNWDPVTQTAIADDEVEYIERDSFIWTIRYPLVDGSGTIAIATTRPETMLGDTAVAVHPDDDRYRTLVGRMLRLPLTNREIPIIADDAVDPAFGTGAVKITPAHDPNDYTMGQRHLLPMINIMTPDGRINEEGGEFVGLLMEEARKAVIERLKREGYLLRTEPHTNRVGLSYRSKAPIEPYISKQWFVRMDGFARNLREAVDTKRVHLVPKNWEHTYFHWIDNLRDWCISRQLWWGHRIPIWYRKDDPETRLCYDGEGLPPEVAAAPDEWEQDPDALDTWFSSALWPFNTLGWPDETPELKKFYPNSVLVTGYDILFFWVARMIFMGEYTLNDAPFPETFLHGLIYGRSYWRKDEHGTVHYISGKEREGYDHGQPVPKDVHSKWEKLSKSKGNVIDPLDLIGEYGTDAMRMALCASGPQNSQIDLDRRRFEEFKNFTNKIWNGARFVFMNLEDKDPLTPAQLTQGLDHTLWQLEDRWIVSTLKRTLASVRRAFSRYAFDHAAIQAYDFFWKEFCAYYVEVSKPILFGKHGTPAQRSNKQKLLAILLCQAVRLLHPIAPYITEELFQKLKKLFADAKPNKDQDPLTQELLHALQAPACAVAPYPQVHEEEDKAALNDFEQVCKVIYTIRNIRGEMQIPAALATDVHIVGDNLQLLEENQHMIPSLVKTKAILLTDQDPSLPFSSTGMVGNWKIVIPLPEEQRAQEKQRLEKERQKLEQKIAKTKAQLANESFVERAPAHLVQKARADLAQHEQELTEILARLH